MRKQLLFLISLLVIGVNLFAGENPRDSLFINRLTRLAEYGKMKLKEQMERNIANDRNNLHHLNNYVIDFRDFEQAFTATEFSDLTTPLNTGGTYTGIDVLGSTHVNSLNNHLIAANNSVNPDIYVAVNLRLGLVVSTKDLTPSELSQIDAKEEKPNRIAKIRVQKIAQVRSNHLQIKTYFTQNMAGGISGEFVLFTWGKYYQVKEDPSVTGQTKLRFESGGYYNIYYDGAASITPYYGQKINAYIYKATSFATLPRNTAAELVTKYKSVIDGLKTALVDPFNIDRLLKEDIIKKNKLEKVGKYVMTRYYDAARGDGALEKLTELAVYLDKVDTAIFNGYVRGVEQDENPHNYWWPINSGTTTEANKNSIAAFLEHVKEYNDAFVYMRQKAAKGVITKDEFFDYFDDHLTWGGGAHKHFLIEPLALLTPNERVNILKAIAADLDLSLINRSTAGPARDEDLVINLLKTTKKEDTKLILEELKANKLLYKIVDKFTFDDFDEVIGGLTMWIFHNYPVIEEKKKFSDPNSSEIAWNELLSQKRAVYFNDSYFGRRNDEAMNADGNIHITVRKWFADESEYDISVDPYKYVMVHFENNFEIQGSKFAKGQNYMLPALTVYMMFVQDTRAKWFTTGKIIFDVALCAIGIGEIKAAIQAGKWARLALAVADLGIGIGDIVINTAFKNEIQEMYPGFFETWQKISLCYGIARLGQVGLESAFKRATIETHIMKNDARLPAETRQLASQMHDELQNPGNFAEFIDEIAPDFEFFKRQVEDLKKTRWDRSRKVSGDAANDYLYSLNPDGDFKPPYKLGTVAEDVEILAGEKKLYCVEYLDQPGPGRWLTDKTFTSVSQMREELALIESFKPSSGGVLVVREYEVIQPLQTRKGIVGEQWDKVAQKTYKGGANQFEFWFTKDANGAVIWDQYLRRTGTQTVLQ